MNITVKELIQELNKHDLNKNIVIYSNEETLIEYDILGTYENEGQELPIFFTRKGLSWKITQIEFPEDLLEDLN